MSCRVMLDNLQDGTSSDFPLRTCNPNFCFMSQASQFCLEMICVDESDVVLSFAKSDGNGIIKLTSTHR